MAEGTAIVASNSPRKQQRTPYVVYHPDWQLVYGKNNVCLEQVSSLLCPGYLAVHIIAQSGVCLSWTPVTVMQATQAHPDVKLCIRAYFHNIKRLIWTRCNHDGADKDALTIEALDGSVRNRLVFLTADKDQFLETLIDETVVSFSPQDPSSASLPPSLSLARASSVLTVSTTPAEHHTCAQAWRPVSHTDSESSVDDCPGCIFMQLQSSFGKQHKNRSVALFRALRKLKPSLRQRQASLATVQLELQRRRLHRHLKQWRIYVARKKQHLSLNAELLRCEASSQLDQPRPEQPSWWTDLTCGDQQWFARCHTQLKDLSAFALHVFHFGLPLPRRAIGWLVLLKVIRLEQASNGLHSKLTALRQTYAQLVDKLETTSTAEDEEGQHFAQQRDVIYYDVLRADRTFFPERRDGEDAANPMAKTQAQMRRVLQVYVLLHRYPGYFQGMSDLLESLLSVLQDEAIAFHAFVAYMLFAAPRFDTMAEDGIQDSLRRFRELLAFLEPEILRHLAQSGADELVFAYRWFLVDFKRECDAPEALSVLERLFAARLCLSVHYPVIMAFARLTRYRGEIADCRRDGAVLKLFNDTQGNVLQDCMHASDVLEEVSRRVKEREW
eukprot:TRINITY_DN9612_c0_g1_i2.p1 TRINITY_DN9612_c0_g1~~TRINITY_DN9612_c0_g1_i2.p1  ORF type:complete len:612 (+),score=131.67 TRINITY_DN9612_c0_g1_i2:116-1951(+)